MNVTLKQIDAFLALADTLSFSGAAKVVHVTQPALSASIRKLEESIGARLFDRSTRNVTLTPVGREFLGIATELLGDLNTGLARVQRFVAGKRGSLVLAVAPSVATGFLPKVIRLFCHAHPDVEVKIHDVLADDCVEMVRAGSADLALTPKRPGAGDLRQVDLFRDQLIVLCSQAHAFAKQKSVRWDDIRSYEHIAKSRSSSVRKLVDAEYDRQGETFRPAYEVDQLGTMVGLVAEGMGIGILPLSVLRTVNMQGLVWRRFSADKAPFRVICAVTSAASSPNPLVEPFVATFLRQLVGKKRSQPPT